MSTFPSLLATVLLALLQPTLCENESIGVLTLSLRHLDHLIRKHSDRIPVNETVMEDILSNGTYISETYINWIKSVNMIPYPVDINIDIEDLLFEIEKYDGLLLTGGRELFYKSLDNPTEKIPAEYLEKVEKIMARVRVINDSKRHFPVWGTCLGFEAILITDSKYTLTRHEVFNQLKNTDRIHIEQSNTRSVKFFTKDELDLMEVNKLVYFNHLYGIFADEVKSNTDLLDKVEVVATIRRVNKNVLAWYEYKHYPFVGVQFHPEKFTKQEGSPDGSLEKQQYFVNKKMALLFQSFIQKPVVYLKDFNIEQVRAGEKRDPMMKKFSLKFGDNSMNVQGEDHFRLSKIGVYDKIEVFVKSKTDES